MSIDLTSTAQFLVATAGATVTVCAPLVSVWLRKQLGAKAGSALSTDLDNAVTAGSRIALDAIAGVAAHNRTLDTHSAAIDSGARYVLGVAQGAVTAMGLTPKHVAAMVGGEVAKILGEKPAAATSPAVPTSPATQPQKGTTDEKA